MRLIFCLAAIPVTSATLIYCIQHLREDLRLEAATGDKEIVLFPLSSSSYPTNNPGQLSFQALELELEKLQLRYFKGFKASIGGCPKWRQEVLSCCTGEVPQLLPQ